MPSSIIDEPLTRSANTRRPFHRPAGSSRTSSTGNARNGRPAATAPRSGIRADDHLDFVPASPLRRIHGGEDMAKVVPGVKRLRAILRVLDQPRDAPVALPVRLPLLRDDACRRAPEVELLSHPLEVDALVTS